MWSVLRLGAVALMCTAASLHAFSQEPNSARFGAFSGTLAPLSEDAFSQRIGTETAALGATPPSFHFANRADVVRSSSNVFAYYEEQSPVGQQQRSNLDISSVDIKALAAPGSGGASAQVRADLLVGMPKQVAALVVEAARNEGVDPNLMLAIARAENGAFDPDAVSGAGAIGLMQMLPQTGAAFGADDLTDPVQNVRASAKFLKVLVDKYANPVLVAAAYNAGEPKVDVHTSLPLIRETADYVTRVVGLYTRAYQPGDIGAVGRARDETRSIGQRRQRMVMRSNGSRARSSMLVFSANEAVLEGVAADEQMQDPDGPMKVRKEGSL